MLESEKFHIQRGNFVVTFNSPPDIPFCTQMEATSVNEHGSGQHKHPVLFSQSDHAHTVTHCTHPGLSRVLSGGCRDTTRAGGERSCG